MEDLAVPDEMDAWCRSVLAELEALEVDMATRLARVRAIAQRATRPAAPASPPAPGTRPAPPG